MNFDSLPPVAVWFKSARLSTPPEVSIALSVVNIYFQE